MAKTDTGEGRAGRHIRVFAAGLAIAWTVAICGSLAWALGTVRVNAIDLVRSRARASHEKDVLYRRWNALHGGVYAPATPETPPNPYLSPEARDATTIDGQHLAKVNPAYMTRQAHELQAEQAGTLGHITSLRPIRSENEPDAWEKSALERFEDGVEEVSSLEDLGGREFLRLMRPLYVEEGCMPCHSSQGYELGEVRGGISVSVPMEDARQTIARTSRPLVDIHVGLWLIGLLGTALASRALGGRIREGESLAAELVRVRAAVDGASDATLVMGLDGRPVYRNVKYITLFGEADTAWEDVRDRFASPDDAQTAFDVAATGELHGADVTMRTISGTELPALLRATAVQGPAGQAEGVLFLIIDITQRKAMEENLRAEATHDSLTGLANRRRLESVLKAEWRRGIRTELPVSIIMVDVDHFKGYNDTNGHTAGDECLRQVSEAIAWAVLRPADVVARVGGEEFVLALPETDADGALEVAYRVRSAVENLRIPHAASEASEWVTVSVGVATATPQPQASHDELVTRADAAMYEAKRLGRNRVVVAEQA